MSKLRRGRLRAHLGLFAGVVTGCALIMAWLALLLGVGDTSDRCAASPPAGLGVTDVQISVRIDLTDNALHCRWHDIDTQSVQAQVTLPLVRWL